MIYAILLLVLICLIYGPNLWVRHIIRKHDKPLEGMPGTGAELATHLIERFQLEGISVQETEKDADYFSPSEGIVGLSPEVFHGKSLSSVAIAAHEVGHAIQHVRQEPVSELRNRYAGKARMIQYFGIWILGSAPLVGALSRNPGVLALLIGAGIVAMLASVAFHALILPEEFDASFDKALPILEQGYLPEPYLPAVREVLKACAYTYVASALSDVLSIWRWLAILR
ncbi:MAG: Zn-dependent protease [Cellvibrionaceae bacterium]|nr:Zn-dependent protease [Cellvibrionaceae bacterium]